MNIKLLKHLELGGTSEGEKNKEVKELFSGELRRLVEVKLRNNEILSKHKAAEPITVLCTAGTGTFRAGADLSEEQKLVAGTLITLEGGIEHEVVAEPALNLLVTKFKQA
jgi:quercetin dioxygenase-like cupin family protein